MRVCCRPGAHPAAVPAASSVPITFRPAQPADMAEIATLTRKERCVLAPPLPAPLGITLCTRMLTMHMLACSGSMNPLGLSAERFTVAADPATGELLGFAQLEPKPTKEDLHFLELRTMIVKTEHRYALNHCGCSTFYLLRTVYSPSMLKWPQRLSVCDKGVVKHDKPCAGTVG